MHLEWLGEQIKEPFTDPVIHMLISTRDMASGSSPLELKWAPTIRAEQREERGRERYKYTWPFQDKVYSPLEQLIPLVWTFQLL